MSLLAELSITPLRGHARGGVAPSTAAKSLRSAAIYLAEARRQLQRAARDLSNAHDLVTLSDRLHAVISLLEQKARRVAS